MGLLTMIHLFARPCLIPPGGKTYFWDDNSCDPISGATSVKLQQLKRQRQGCSLSNFQNSWYYYYSLSKGASQLYPSFHAHFGTRVRIMKRRVRTAAMPFLLSVYVLCLSKLLCQYSCLRKRQQHCIFDSCQKAASCFFTKLTQPLHQHMSKERHRDCFDSTHRTYVSRRVNRLVRTN